MRVLDIGCGDGALTRSAAGLPVRVVGIDGAHAMAAAARRHGPVARGDIAALPIADAAVDAVVAVNAFDHLDWPATGLEEAHRVLRPGGLFVAGTISRADAPELAPFWRPTPTPFDAEDAPRLVAATFGNAEVEAWDAPLITLPDRDAVRDFLLVRQVERHRAQELADAVGARRPLPLTLTKRGALVLARRESEPTSSPRAAHGRGC